MEEEQNTKQNPAFLEYVYDLNQGVQVMEALSLSLQDIDDLNMDQMRRIGLKSL